MQKLEYCVITNVNFVHRTSSAQLLRLTMDGLELVKRLLNNDQVAGAMAELGEMGWEISAAVNTESGMHSLYFQRPKE